MTSLYMSSVCISVLYIRSLFAYPIQGSYVKDMSPGFVNTRQYETEEWPINLSRILHLSNTYFELLQAQHIDFLHDPNLDTNSRYDLLKTLGKDELGKDSTFTPDSTDIANSAHSQVEAVDSWRAKRQQGWYTQYGKRDHRTLLSTQINENNKANRLITYADNVPRKLTSSSAISPLDSPGQLASAKSAWLTNTELLQQFDGLTSANDFSNKQFTSNDADDKDMFVSSGSGRGLQPEIPKRQQGWFISYGRRNG